MTSPAERQPGRFPEPLIAMVQFSARVHSVRGSRRRPRRSRHNPTCLVGQLPQAGHDVHLDVPEKFRAASSSSYQHKTFQRTADVCTIVRYAAPPRGFSVLRRLRQMQIDCARQPYYRFDPGSSDSYFESLTVNSIFRSIRHRICLLSSPFSAAAFATRVAVLLALFDRFFNALIRSHTDGYLKTVTGLTPASRATAATETGLLFF